MENSQDKERGVTYVEDYSHVKEERSCSCGLISAWPDWWNDKYLTSEFLSLLKNMYPGCTVKGIPILIPFGATVESTDSSADSDTDVFVLVPYKPKEENEKIQYLSGPDIIVKTDFSAKECKESADSIEDHAVEVIKQEDHTKLKQSRKKCSKTKNDTKNTVVLKERPKRGCLKKNTKSNSSPRKKPRQKVIDEEHDGDDKCETGDAEEVEDEANLSEKDTKVGKQKRKAYEDLDWMDSDASEETIVSDNEDVYNDDIVDDTDDMDKSTVKSKKRKYEKKTVKKKPKEKVIKPPWISIKLEDHSDKYTIETYNSIEQRHRGSEVKETLYKCLVCNHFNVGRKDELEKHIEEHVNGYLKCEDCPFEANSRHEYCSHRLKFHETGRRKRMCYLCGFVTAVKEGFHIHMGEVHNQPHFKCIYCDLKFIRPKQRTKHYTKSHVAESKYCDKCGEFHRTMTDAEYEEHLKSCSANVTCNECGKLLANRRIVLWQHKRRWHTLVRHHQCHLCSYSAKCKKNLQRHLLIHEGNHPYRCDHCSFTCVQKVQLTSHMRTHTGEKPFRCDQCAYAAAWNVQLKEHKKVHELNTAVTCGYCGIVVKNENCLNMHVKKEHSSLNNRGQV